MDMCGPIGGKLIDRLVAGEALADVVKEITTSPDIAGKPAVLVLKKADLGKSVQASKCNCPKCSYTVEAPAGISCGTLTCKKCGAKMKSGG